MASVDTRPAAVSSGLWATWAVVGAVAVGGLVALWWAVPRLPMDRLWEVALFCALAALSQRMPVSLFRNSSISVAFALAFAALVDLGPAAGVVVQLGPGLVLCVTPYLKPPRKMLFNALGLPLQMWAAGAAYAWLGGAVGPAHLDWGLVGPAVAAAAVFVGLNTGLLAAVIGLETGTSARAVWLLNYRWLLPNYVGLGLVGLGMAVAARAMGVAGLAAFCVPLGMAHYSFKLYVAQTAAVRERNAALRESNARLDLANARLGQRVGELAALNRIGLSLNGMLEPGAVLDQILESALGLVPAQGAAVLLTDAASGRLVVAASVGLPAGAGVALAAAGGPAAAALAGREVALEETAAAGAGGALAAAGVGAMLALPLRASGAVGGVFALTFAAAHEVGPDERMLLSTLAQQAATAVHNARLYREIEAGYLSTVQALVQVTDGREGYAAGHAERVRAYCAAAADALGLDPGQRGTLELAALFHDLGHVGVPETVLGKAGPLTAEEWAVVRRHPELGVSILQRVPRMEAVVPVILQHHERYDGQGYPAGLLGDDSSVLAQVLAVADAYEAMTSARPHRGALSRPQAVAELRAHSGTQFAPRVVEAFVAATEAAVQTAPSAEHALLRLLRPTPAAAAA